MLNDKSPRITLLGLSLKGIWGNHSDITLRHAYYGVILWVSPELNQNEIQFDK